MSSPDLAPTRRLRGADRLRSFDSGLSALNEWHLGLALADQRAGRSVTYVLSRDSRIIGFYTLAPHLVEADDPATRLSAGLPVRRPIPVFLLAHLGLDRSEHGGGLGAALLQDALKRCAAAGTEIGGRAVVVDAKGDALAGFYRRFGFTPLRGNPRHLYVLMKDLRRSLSEAAHHRQEIT